MRKKNNGDFMSTEIPVDVQILIDNKSSGSDYAVYLYVKHRLIEGGAAVGLYTSKIKQGYDPADYEGLRGISRDEIRDHTHFTLKQVNKTISRLQELELIRLDENDNGRYYYPIHFTLPFIHPVWV